METFNVHEAKTHLSRLLARVSQGETVLIGKAGVPIAVLSPYVAPSVRRAPGSMKGKITLTPDFDSEDEVLVGLFERGGDNG